MNTNITTDSIKLYHNLVKGHVYNLTFIIDSTIY